MQTVTKRRNMHKCNSSGINRLLVKSISPGAVVYFLGPILTEPYLKIRLIETFTWTLLAVTVWILLKLWVRTIPNFYTRLEASFVIGNFGVVALSISMQIAAMRYEYHKVIGLVHIIIFLSLTKVLYEVFIKLPASIYIHDFNDTSFILFLVFIFSPTALFCHHMPLSMKTLHAWAIHIIYSLLTGHCLMDLWLVVNRKFQVSRDVVEFEAVKLKIV